MILLCPLTIAAPAGSERQQFQGSPAGFSKRPLSSPAPSAHSWQEGLGKPGIEPPPTGNQVENVLGQLEVEPSGLADSPKGGREIPRDCQKNIDGTGTLRIPRSQPFLLAESGVYR